MAAASAPCPTERPGGMPRAVRQRRQVRVTRAHLHISRRRHRARRFWAESCHHAPPLLPRVAAGPRLSVLFLPDSTEYGREGQSCNAEHSVSEVHIEDIAFHHRMQRHGELVSRRIRCSDNARQSRSAATRHVGKLRLASNAISKRPTARQGSCTVRGALLRERRR